MCSDGGVEKRGGEMNRTRRYRGVDGEQYIRQRKGAISDHVQSLRASLFKDIMSDDVVVMDFGCGTGGVIKRLRALRRVGVEVGTEAADLARSEGIEVFASLENLPDNSVDVGISFHAIEHVDNPLAVLEGIGRVVKPGGRVRLVVPCETPLLRKERSWQPNSDRHLFTWTPLLFGNLAESAGLQNINARIEPMPTASRLLLGLAFLPPVARFMHLVLSLRRNSLNVVLDAVAP